MLFQIFKVAYKAFSKSFRYIILISLFVNIPRNAIIAWIPDAWLMPINMLFQMELQELLTAMIPVRIVMYILWIIFDPLIIAAFAYIALQWFAKEEVELPGILDNTLQKWPSLIITAFLFHSLMMLGTMFFIIPGLYIMIVFTFYAVVVIDRGKWGFPALVESFRVVKGNFFRTLLVLAITSALVAAFNTLITYSRYFDSDFANRIANVLMLTLRDTYTGYFTMVLVMYYFYLTKTKEDFNAAEESK